MRDRFAIIVAVEPGDIDQLGHVNNTVYLRWAQDVAVAHWQAVALPAHQVQLLWMALRHEIDYKHPAVLGDVVILQTWIGAAEGIRFERFTEILRERDQKLLAQAKTIWCPIDAVTRRPARVPSGVRELFSKGG